MNLFTIIKNLFMVPMLVLGASTHLPQTVPNLYALTSSKPSTNIAKTVIKGTLNQGGQTVEFSITFPKSGGEAQGQVSGACQGKIIGSVTGSGGTIIKGNIIGSCLKGFFTQALNFNFNGTINYAQQSLNLYYQAKVGFFKQNGNKSLNVVIDT